MIFKEGDEIIFENHKRECVCKNESYAIFGQVVDHYYSGDEKIENEGEVISLENLIALPNNENLEDTIEFTRVGGQIGDAELNINVNVYDADRLSEIVQEEIERYAKNESDNYYL